jgi:hypothetical protein
MTHNTKRGNVYKHYNGEVLGETEFVRTITNISKMILQEAKCHG